MASKPKVPLMANKRNIALVINDLKGNGAERVAITLAGGFREAGHSASIVCFKRHIELPIPRIIPVFIFSEKRFRWIPRSIRRMCKFNKAKRQDRPISAYHAAN